MLNAVLGCITGLGIGLAVGFSSLEKVMRQRDEARKESLKLRRERLDRDYELEFWKDETRKYQRAYVEVIQEMKSNSSSQDDEVLAAIKYAMTNSHPDKPYGNSEDFIKFHKLYKKYCK